MTFLSHLGRFCFKIIRLTSWGLFLFFLFFISQIKIPTPNIPENFKWDNFQRQQLSETHFTCNSSWLKKNKEGIWVMYLEGSPFERGITYGVLSKELMEKQEVHFVNQINEIVPNQFIQFVLKLFVSWFNKDIPANVPDEFLTEIYGVSQSFSDKYDFIGPKYYRILNYHAAHDIGHALKDLNMVGCTSFAVNHNRSEDSTLLIGRNFDFYMGDAFAEDKLLVFVSPTEGYKYASYSWAGLTGVVSGMNEKGLTVTLNASKSVIPTGAKDPISLLAREILQYASTIEEAKEIAKKRQTFVSESLMIGSAIDDRAVLIEKSPENIDFFDSKSNTLVCSNHYQSNFFAGDSININNIKASDSQHRYDRVSQLLESYNALSPKDAVDILRNQQGLGNTFLGYGNPKAVNQLIAHHGILFKPTSKQLWVSTPPYQIGQFIAYDLNTAFDNPESIEHLKALKIEADPFLNTNEYLKYEEFKTTKQLIQKSILLGKDLTEIKLDVEKFISNNPESYVTYLVLGDYFKGLNDCETATKYYSVSLKHHVASLEEKTIIEQNIASCASN